MALLLAVAALAALGLVLRLMAARGALWLDEAWSAQFALDADGPFGVLLRIHHDNNHLLNTWWLQLLGPGVPPLAKRALSIACGTAMVPLAAMFAGRRSATAALIAALLFAVSPIMVTYGAEARGYAPMMAATLVALIVVDRWFDKPTRYASLWLSLAMLIGVLAQFLMIASLAAVIGWLFWQVRRSRGPDPALRETVAVTLGPVLLVAVVLGTVALTAMDSRTGFEVGDYEAFALHDWAKALATAFGWTLGIGPAGIVVLALAALLVAVLLVGRRQDARTPFYTLAILGYPLAFVALRIGNAGIPRYYLLAMLALLLLLADCADAALRTPGRRRIIVTVLLLLLTVGSVRLDAIIAVNRRADPAGAIAALHRHAPDGAVLAVVNARMVPVLRFAASDVHYPLRIVGGRCRQAPFLLADGNANSANLAGMRYCGTAYRQIAHARSRGLSGTWWWLFEREQ